MKIRWTSVALVALLCCTRLSAEERVIRLYDGLAPGSENWKQEEKQQYLDVLQARVVTNVVNPTLTVFEPEASLALGTGVIICPGGGFHILAMDHEGYDVARWLATKGVTSFVLKYRLVETKTDNPFSEMMQNFSDFEANIAPVVKLAVADGLAALDYVRKHAEEFALKSDRIGIMGFSAGGTVAASAACEYSEATRPSFAATIYPAWPEGSRSVPSDAPPMFIVAATDDQLNLAPDSVRLYQQWAAATKPAELHMFSNGGHGFGIRKQNLPSDEWIELFTAWLAYQGVLTK